jgi:hypothetical protein
MTDALFKQVLKAKAGDTSAFNALSDRTTLSYYVTHAMVGKCYYFIVK